MIRTRSLRVAAVVAGAALALCGCDPAVPTGAERPGAERSGTEVSAAQREWMTAWCDALGEVVAVAGTPRTVDPSQLARARDLLADQVREVRGAVARLDGELDRLGEPPVPDGGRAREELQELVTKRDDALGKSAAFVGSADPDGTLEYVQVARAAQSAQTAGPILINETSRVEGLEEAFAATPACRAVDPGEKGRR